jgi:uncharacterized protein (DUF1778 family)
MMPNLATERISLRTTTEVKRMIEQAAALSGISVSAFVLEHAYQAARRVILEQQQIKSFNQTVANK